MMTLSLLCYISDLCVGALTHAQFMHRICSHSTLYSHNVATSLELKCYLPCYVLVKIKITVLVPFECYPSLKELLD